MDWLRSAVARSLLAGLLILGGWAGAEAAPKVCDRCAETSTSTGTGTFNLAGAVSKYKPLVTIGTGNQGWYCIVHRTAVEWECGIGTVTDALPDTLARDAIKSGTSGTSAVNFSAGTKDVFLSPIADYFNNTALLTPGGALQLGDGSLAAPTYSFASDPDTGITIDTGFLAAVVDGQPVAWFANGAIFLFNSGALQGGHLQLVGPSGTGGTVSRLTFGAKSGDVAAPTPSANTGVAYTDSTDKVFKFKDDAGAVSLTTRPSNCTSGQFVNGLNSAGVLGCGTPAGGGGGVPVDTQSFTANGTWTKPSGGQTIVSVLACGSGGGGGAGFGAAQGQARNGGGGGGGGYCRQAFFQISELSATESVTVSAGGTGATGVVGTGSDGGAGGPSSFGTKLNAPGGGGGSTHGAGATGGSGAGCTGAGLNGTTATGVIGGACFAAGGPIAVGSHQDGHIGGGASSVGTSGAAGNGSTFGGGAGAGSSTTGLANSNNGGASTRSGGGGGAGGGVSTATPGIVQNGTDGGASTPGAIASTGGGGTGGASASACGSGGNGVNGVDGGASNGGSGGGGGAGVNSAQGCNGGNGGVGGGGGGGGGGGTNVGGNGGNGGAGWVIVVSW